MRALGANNTASYSPICSVKATHQLFLKERDKLPFTPFHMGAALIVKPALNRNFSVITFGIAQIAMDIEPGVGMLTGADVLHGPTHTILGALVIAYLVTLIAPSVCSYLLTKWNKEVIHYKLPRLVQSEAVPKTAVIIGAFFGTLSHVALDSLMHHDIQPLLPFSTANPLMGLVTHDGVYQACAITGVLGTIAWFALRWIGRSSQVIGVDVAPKPRVTGAHQGFWTPWVRELRLAWFWTISLSVVPCLLYGSAIFSILVLVAAVLIGVPSAVICQLLTKGSKRGWRRLAVMVLVSALTTVFALQGDKQIPVNATPITNALESFREETRHYPDTLEALAPKHLANIPEVRFSLVQPQINYRVREGKPYLTIPSVAGDMFAMYEYDFESKSWKHHS